MSKQSEVAFNIGVRESNFVADTYIKIFKDYRDGRLEDWYWSINVLREMINAHLKQDRQDAIDKTESNIIQKLVTWKKARNKGEYLKLKKDFADIVKGYQREIMFCMKKLGYLPTKKDRAQLGF